MKEFKIGDIVRHKVFGIGVILKGHYRNYGVKFLDKNKTLHDLGSPDECEYGYGWWVDDTELTLVASNDKIVITPEILKESGIERDGEWLTIPDTLRAVKYNPSTDFVSIRMGVGNNVSGLIPMNDIDNLILCLVYIKQEYSKNGTR